MPRVFQKGDEPVRGYRLIKNLGKGSFGDVWQASGPGGTEVAFKIVRLDDKSSLKSLNSIEQIKKIRHPNLVPILAMWLKSSTGLVSATDAKKRSGSGTHTLGEFSLDEMREEQPEELYLAMGLGEKSLLERFKECKEQGQSGIPTAELIGYFEDAARAVDHLNSPKHDLGQGPVPLPHCNIKPQNILIVGGAAQVSDFGLARILNENQGMAYSGGMVAFTAPELLESGQPTLYSDQYSLAITYHYLRTGALPFSMNETNVVLTEALEGRLDLSRLTTSEQQVIRRATSRRPEARFANCQDLTRELRRAIERSGTVQTDGLVLEPNREIVPGHKLVSLLGRGAYGEVWQAQAPGRLPIALKIIKDLDRASGRGRQEFRALEIIQNISHTAMMELRAYWLLDRHGQPIPDELRGHPGSPVPATLIIATRLADRNLTQVMEKYREEGKAGIPAKELLNYIKQVAGALDYLNQPKHRLGNRLVSIQHRDVKPDNIMIANDSIKLTDFGLAKVLETDNIVAEIRQDSVGFTFHYAAPEVLRGKVTKWSDQYSLAITYFQLRTGKLPYGQECSAYDQMMRQLEGELDLAPLMTAERNVVARATSVVPEERFPSCQAFVDALMKAVPAHGELEKTGEDEEEYAESRDAATPHRRDPLTEMAPTSLAQPHQRDQRTMPVMLQEGEKYPSPLRTPFGSEIDTDLETPPITKELMTPGRVQKVTAVSTFKQRYLPLVAVFVVGIGMAVVVHQFLRGRTPDFAAMPTATYSQEPEPPQPREFVGPIYVERNPNDVASNTVNKPNDKTPVAATKPVAPPVKPPELITTSGTTSTPVPPPVTVLGKNVADRDFGTFLEKRLDQMIASSAQPAIFTRSYRELEPVPTSALTSKLLAFRAECLIEGESKNLPQADTLIKQAHDLNAPSAYSHYVQARIWQELGQSQRAIQSLEESLKRDISLTGLRRDRAIAMLETAAMQVNFVTDARTLSAQLASPLPTWLPLVARFLGKSPENSQLALLMAVQEGAPRNPSALKHVLTPGIIDAWSNKPHGPILITSLKLKQAEAAVTAKQPDLALSLFEDCWIYVQKHRETFEVTSPLTLYQRILEPAQKAAATVKASAQRDTQLASILAAYAGMIYESPFEAWPRPENKPALRVAADAYGEAARLYPGTGKIKASYLTGQGKCLNRLGSLAPADITAITRNAAAATTADPTYAGGWNLMGLARYYRTTQENSTERLRNTLTESIDAYDKAIRLAEQLNPRDREIAQYCSNRSLAKSLLGDYTPIENDQRRLLYQDAIQDALKSTTLDTSYESAWEALGQARERLAGLLQGVPARTVYAEAVTAYRKLLDARPSLAQARAYLGRCYIRWALDENKDAAKLDLGFDELSKAIKSDADMALAHFWLGRYYLAKNDAGRANESFLRAIKHPDLGHNLLSETMNLLADQPLVLLPLLNNYLPANLAQCNVSHVRALLVRSQLGRASIKTNPPTAWSEAEPVLMKSITDAQVAHRLTSAADVKQQAIALEAVAGCRLKLFLIADESQGKLKLRSELMADIRALIKTEQETTDSWQLAMLLARFLDQDAIDAAEDKAREYRQDAIKAIDFAIHQAPATQKDQLRRLKGDIQSKLK